jgi:hypothetical protein
MMGACVGSVGIHDPKNADHSIPSPATEWDRLAGRDSGRLGGSHQGLSPPSAYGRYLGISASSPGRTAPDESIADQLAGIGRVLVPLGPQCSP